MLFMLFGLTVEENGVAPAFSNFLRADVRAFSEQAAFLPSPPHALPIDEELYCVLPHHEPNARVFGAVAHQTDQTSLPCPLQEKFPTPL